MSLFRDLTVKEQAEFRKWARDNYKPFTEIQGIWHPIVQEECVQINRETNQRFLATGNPTMTFERWMQAIDNVIERVAGLSVYDLADWPFRDSYDRGDIPGDVAKMMLEESGFYSK